MNDHKRNRYIIRERILKLLSDGEVDKVSAAETMNRLDEGEEYIDLEELEMGVRRADGVPVHMGRVLPRKAVLPDTWDKIVAQLGASARDTLRSG